MESYQRLEEEFGRWAGVDNCVACNSGTSALHLALEALEIPLGSEVILPTFTMVACARAVSLAGLVPVFIDCGEDLNIDVSLIDQAITDKTRAIMVVHIYGRPCDMMTIADIANKYDLYVIEDLAECHGLCPDPGTDAACWSFYRNKIICGEEGGMCAFKLATVAKRASTLRSLGFTFGYNHIPRGHNYRLANCLADLILDSLKDYTLNASYRLRVTEWYDNVCPSFWKMPQRYSNWVYDIRLRDMTSVVQDRLLEELRSKRIEARHAFKPLHMQEEYKRCVYVGGERLSERVSREVIYLPCHPEVLREEVTEAIATVARLA